MQMPLQVAEPINIQPPDPETATKRSIRVMRIIDRLNLGGPARHVLWLTAGLDQRFTSWLVTGSAAAGEVDLATDAALDGVDLAVIPEFSRELHCVRDLSVFLKLLRLMWRIKPDVVHTHKAKAGALGRIAALLYRWLTPSALWLKPRKCIVIHTYHGHIFHSYYGRLKTKVFLVIERLLARLATDCIIVLSKQQQREIVGTFKVGNRNRVEIIPLGLDCRELCSSAGRFRAEHHIPATEQLIGTAGRLCEVKNYSLFIQAAAILAKMPSQHARRFVVAGEGHLRTRLEEQARRLGIDKEVLFAGACREMGDFYADMDIVALTSLNEGTPLVLLEAMACERPVVSTEVGGVVDIMGDRIERRTPFSVWNHGLTVPSGDPQAFAEALHFLLANPELRREMGRNASAYVESQFCKSRLLTDIQNLYAHML